MTVIWPVDRIARTGCAQIFTEGLHEDRKDAEAKLGEQLACIYNDRGRNKESEFIENSSERNAAIMNTPLDATVESSDTLVRVWPRSMPEAFRIASAHIARYQFAGRFVAGKSVYDAACGLGYGSRVLARNARQVIGMDISEKAITWARTYFQRPNIQFLAADLIEPWPVSDQADAIVSFETMEHVPDPERFLDHLCEHLAQDGLLVMSVPNGPRDRSRRNNPSHLHYFSQDDLKSIIERRFSHVSYFSQIYRKNLLHYAAKVLRLRRGRLVRNFDFVAGLCQEAKNWLVRARR